MALRAVINHPKFTRLKKLLKLPTYAVMGCLETVWHFTGRYTPHGDLGKYSDAEIESWLEWDGVDGALIAALVQSGWLDDEDSEHRLLVHDWSEHADIYVNTELARKCLRFADGRIPQSGRLNQEERIRFREWLDKEGEPAPVIGRPKRSQNAADSQPKVRQSEQEVSRKSDSLPVRSAESPKPVPVPEPVPEPEPNTKTKPSRAKPREGPRKTKVAAEKRDEPTKTLIAEKRHGEFKAEILTYWKAKNPDDECPWDGSEGKALGMYLSASPNTTVEQFRKYLSNRAQSEAVTHGDRPSLWIRKITSYAHGPLDRFGKQIPPPPPKPVYVEVTGEEWWKETPHGTKN